VEIVELGSGVERRVRHRAGTAWVAWADLAAQQRRRGEPVRSLLPGEDVVVRFADHTEQPGWVLRNSQERGGSYVIVLGQGSARRDPVGGAPAPRPR
jgi:hypothetical protein